MRMFRRIISGLFVLALIPGVCRGEMDWVKIFTMYEMPIMFGYGMAFDEARGVSFVFGPYSSGRSDVPVYTYDGTDWTMINPSGDWPEARAEYGIAYDPDREVIVIFGGYSDGSPDFMGDTWEWDGAHWEQKFPGHSPCDRIHCKMVYFESTGKVVLFGGCDERIEYRNDTWMWDGSDWQEVETVHAPSPRSAVGLVYDSHRDRIVLYGGSVAQYQGIDDTWVFDGTDWEKLTPRNHPPALDYHVMVYDSARDRCVVFGGIPPGGHYFDETWEFDGTTWYQVNVSHHPEARGISGACYDSRRHRLVLFGGLTESETLQDTWEYYDIPAVTPTPCTDTGVCLVMPAHTFAPGDICYLKAWIRHVDVPWTTAPFFCLLSYAGVYWYYPGWTEEVSWAEISLDPSGETEYTVISPFTWPWDVGCGDGFTFYSAVTDPEMQEVMGDIGEWSFGWTDEPRPTATPTVTEGSA